MECPVALSSDLTWTGAEFKREADDLEIARRELHMVAKVGQALTDLKFCESIVRCALAGAVNAAPHPEEIERLIACRVNSMRGPAGAALQFRDSAAEGAVHVTKYPHVVRSDSFEPL